MISKKVHRAIKKFNVQRSTFNVQQKAHDLLHELWKGQCNDAYWHGIFGGLYLPHLRSSLYAHLLKAEYLADSVLDERTAIEQSDYDCDGFEDITINTKDISLSATEKGGSLIELSLKKKAVNILDILTRRPEAYHAKITQALTTPGGTKTIHEHFMVKEADIADYMVYDSYRRTSLLDHFFPFGTDIDDLMRSEYEELGDFIEGIYSLKHGKKGEKVTITFSRKGSVLDIPVKLTKTLKLTKPLELRVGYLITGVFSGLFATEFNISLLGSPYSSLIVGNKNLPIRTKGIHHGVKDFYLRDEFLGLRVGYTFDEAIDLWHYPVETVSLSEQGVERNYQGTAFLFVKSLDIRDERRLGFTVQFSYDLR